MELAQLFGERQHSTSKAKQSQKTCAAHQTATFLLYPLCVKKTPMKLTQKAQDPNASKTQLKELAEHKGIVRCTVAKNPLAPPELLSALAQTKGKKTLEAVAQNPNTPPEVLIKVGMEKPEALLQNPFFPLMFFESPEQVSKIPSGLWYRLLQVKELPTWLWDFLLQSSHYIVRSASKHPNLPEPHMQLLATDKMSSIRVNLATNPALSIEVIEILSKDPDREVRINIAKHPKLPASLFGVLHKESSFLRRALAGNRNLSAEQFQLLSQDTSPAVLATLAQNPMASPDLLRGYASSRSKALRTSVARNENAPNEILSRLARDKAHTVRAAAATNPKLLQEELLQLASDSDFSVRLKIALRADCPVHLLEAFAKDKSHIVRKGAAENPNTPEATLLALTVSTQSHPSAYSWSIQEHLLKNPSTPTKALELLATRSQYLKVRAEQRIRGRAKRMKQNKTAETAQAT
jgi:hypothetical protein